MTHEPHPLRIQRKRLRGSRMPPGSRYVGRPTKYGNPFRLYGDNEYLRCDASHRRVILTPWVIFDHDQDIRNNPVTPGMVVDHYRRWLTGEFNESGIVRPCELTQSDFAELRGLKLACFCPLTKPCHADVLAELANR